MRPPIVFEEGYVVPLDDLAGAGAGQSMSTTVSPIFRTPVALNAGTTYGLNGSAANNYGLGSSYISTTQIQADEAGRRAAPSWLWLLAILAFVWWVSK